MLTRSKLFLALFSLLLWTAPAAFAADDLKTVLAKLDASAAKFHSASADFEFDTAQTEPIPDTDKQTGTVYYERKSNGFQAGVHIREENGHVTPKTIVVSGGVLKMYEKLPDQLTISRKVGKYEGYLSLGFGASGTALQEKWDIRYLGSETMNEVKVARLELIAKDPDVLKLFPKVIIWIDPDRAVSLKQYFDEGQGQSRTCTYSNIKLNQSLPSDAFTIKTDSKTQVINR